MGIENIFGVYVVWNSAKGGVLDASERSGTWVSLLGTNISAGRKGVLDASGLSET